MQRHAKLNNEWDVIARPRTAPSKRRAHHAHALQFYESDEFLADTVAGHLAAGLSAGSPSVAIATEAHREAFVRGLTRRGYDVDGLSASGQLTLVDARQTLASFMDGNQPNPERFRETVGALLQGASVAGQGTPLLYGEMVDVLWSEGRREAAIRLEELWNDLAGSFEFSLLCAYAMGGFADAAHADQFSEICALHARVAPTEHYLGSDEPSRLLDITLLQQRARSLETELQRRAELECQLRQVAEERELLLERERAARAEAESANRAKSEFLAVMSHELRTPLNAIAGHVQLMEMGMHGPVTVAQRAALDRVARSQRHLLSLINSILNLSRIESGHVEYAVENVAIAPLLADAVAVLEPMFAARGLTCEVQLTAEIGTGAASVVRADRDKLQQVLFNLLTNAIKFTPAGGCIRLETDADGERVGIHVRDTGVGIPAESLERIFEPFVQLGSCSSSRRDGVGLGLTISRDLARGMGGDITATSVVGRGTTFSVWLPRPPAPARER